MKLKAALVAFKTEKRKDFEMDAAKVIEEIYKKHKFRQELNQAVVSRKYMI
jgi:hypothetical protein